MPNTPSSPVTSLARKPKSMTFEQAAGVPIAAETAYRALHEAGNIERGQTVLIHGAAGGVGSAAVQIAKAAGARVIGTASPNNHEFLQFARRRPGHRLPSQKFEDMVKNVDLVLNTADAETNARSIGVVRQGGTLVSIVGPPNPAACAAAKIRCARPDRDTGASNADMLARVVELADAGKFKVFVDSHLSAGRCGQGLGEEPRGPHARQAHHPGVGRPDDEAPVVGARRRS